MKHCTAFVGSFAPELREELRGALGEPSAFFFAGTEQAREQMELLDGPVRCVLLDLRARGASEFVSWLRSSPRMHVTPLVALAPAPDQAMFSIAHALGADDVALLSEPQGIARRVLSLPNGDASPLPMVGQGRSIVAHPGLEQRRLFGRVLRHAGFDVDFAADADELLQLAELRGTPALVVAADSLPPDGPFAAGQRLQSTSKTSRLPLIVVTESAQQRMHAAETGLDAVAFLKVTAPPQNLLFLANELLRPDVTNVRSSPRLLLGEMCSFRSATESVPRFGMTYNISVDGLYIRTLDPPASHSEAWIELCPPGAETLVHLRSRVVWVRPYGTGGLAPAGFGARILRDRSPAPDLQTYTEAYERLRRSFH